MAAKMTCPKCGNDTFKLSTDIKQGVFVILFITCAKCGWNTQKVRPISPFDKID